MAYLEVANLAFILPSGRVLLEDLSFRVPGGQRVAIVGANGTGKTTVLKIIAGEEPLQTGQVQIDGRIGYMPQFVGSLGQNATVTDLLLRLSPPAIRSAYEELQRTEKVMQGAHGHSAQMRYADALAKWGEVGGYEAEVLWDTCIQIALGVGFDKAGDRPVSTLSGGEQKRVALEALFRSDADILLLDEPDNFLDIEGKEWLERTLNASLKTILYVSHDRALLTRTSTRIVTIEAGSAWTHPASFATYIEARAERLEKIEEEQRRYSEEHARIVEQIREFKRRAALNDKFATKARNAEHKLERFEQTNAPRKRAEEQDVKMRLRGGRTGKIALRLTGLSIDGLVEAFDSEIYFGERVGVVGPNGTGKSHFLKLLAGETIAHHGEWKLGARVEPSIFSQLHEHPELRDLTLVEIVRARGFDLGSAMGKLKHYELREAAHNPFGVCSGGQQARFQILLMELESPTMLLLDEPTDNLDIDSAEALEEGLERYEGTVIAVTHDRWFMRMLDRFLIFDEDGKVTESMEPPYALTEGLV
jgi:ATPase subunit of ABC transporter with duplicated ATPase domains